MQTNEIRLERLTRKEFRDARDLGHYKLSIIATGSIEQHLEHLTLEQDISQSTHIAERVAQILYPEVIVVVPMSIGIAEHHMHFGGTITAKPGSWLGVLYDSVESMMRHGINKVLVLKGHGGNVAPVEGVINQWNLQLTQTLGKPLSPSELRSFRTHHEHNEALLNRKSTGVDLRFHSYWDAITEDSASEILDTGIVPGHAGEFETSTAMYSIPSNVRAECISHSPHDSGANKATVAKGQKLIDLAIRNLVSTAEEMLSI